MRRMLQIAAILIGGMVFAGSAGAQATKTFHANLTGPQEVPPTTSTGTGTATFTLDPATKQVTWTVTFTGLSGDATAAHIHGPAAPGANAGVVVNLGSNGLKSPITGSAPMTDAQIADLQAGKDYINVHTAANKGGEIRGQITP